MPQEIALLTNPTSGKGRGARTVDEALPRLRDAGYVVRNLVGRDADEALDLARKCVADGVETLVVVGGDGMVHLALQALADTETRLGLIPAGTGNDVARYFDIPRKDTVAATDVVIGGKERRVDLARIGSKYFVTVLAAGFDAIVNERANEMTWPKGQMRYNLATWPSCARFKPISYVVDIDGEQHRFEAMMVAVGNGPSFGGGLRITEGAVLDDGLLDVVMIRPMSKLELLRTYPKLFKGTHIHHPDYRHHHAKQVTIAAPGITAYADGERIARAAPDRGGRAARPARPGAMNSTPASSPVGAVRPLPPQPRAPHAGRLRVAPRVRARRLPGARLPGARGRPVGAGRRAHRVRQDDRRRVRRTPRPREWPQGLLHHPDQGAVEPEVQRPGQAVRRRQGRPAHR